MLKPFKPFKIIPQIWSLILLWVIFFVIFGLTGIIGSFCLSKTNSIEWITKILKTGSFYTIGIALCASSIFKVLSEFLLPEPGSDVKFKEYKIISVGLSILLILIIAFLYSSVLVEESITVQKALLQSSLYILALLMSLYLFCIGHLKYDYENFKDLDDSIINRIKRKAQKISDDGSGVKL